MATKGIQAVPATKYASNTNAHYNIPLLQWFKADSQSIGFTYSFTPDLGSTSPEFSSNVGITDANNYYVTSLGSQFWPEEGKLDNGFEITKPNLSQMKEFNVQVSAGTGLWMPCAIFASFSFYYQNETAHNSNWVPRNIALELGNVKEGGIKTWGAGWDNKSTTSTTGRIYVLNNEAKVNSIRNMGPDWYIYGVRFNFKSESTSTQQTPKARIVDCRMGWRHDGLQGTNKMILPKMTTWSGLKDYRAKGLAKFGG